VPGTYSFWDLHVAIQDSMGWLDSHLHLFRTSRPGTRDMDTFEGDEPILLGWSVPIASYCVADGIAGREHQDRHAEALLAERLEHAEPVALGQHHVEDHEVPGRAVHGALDPRGAVAGDLDRVPFLLEAFPDEAGDLPVVLDHQDAHTRSVVAHAPRPVNAAADAVLCSRPPCSIRATYSSTWATGRSS
jgi:hypothetical protein